MIAQNSDSHEPIWFLSRDRQSLKHLAQLADAAIERQIYYRPSAFPRVDKFDMWEGSCFRDWIVPTAAYVITHEQGHVLDIDQVRGDVGVSVYREFVLQEIQQQVHDIYQRHDTVNMLHSGGVDSMVILALVLSLGYARRTRLLCVENLATQHTKTLRYDQSRINNIKKLYQDLGSEFLGTEIISIDASDISSIINSGRDWFHMQNYVTSAIFDRYPDHAWIGGGHGNRTLLHQEIFLDAMRRDAPHRTGQIKHEIQTLSARMYLDQDHIPDFDTEPRPLENISHAIKYFDRCNGWRGNLLYSPLGSEGCFQMLRRLDFSEISVEQVVCAGFAKDIINQTAPDLLSWCDAKQSNYDFNVLQDIPSLLYNELDPDQLWIPNHLHHDPQGLDWIHWCLDQARQTNQIDINVLVSIKNLQLIHQRVNNAAAPSGDDAGSSRRLV